MIPVIRLNRQRRRECPAPPARVLTGQKAVCKRRPRLRPCLLWRLSLGADSRLRLVVGENESGNAASRGRQNPVKCADDPAIEPAKAAESINAV